MLLKAPYANCKNCPVQAWEAGSSLPCLSLLGSEFQPGQRVFGWSYLSTKHFVVFFFVEVFFLGVFSYASKENSNG